MARKTMPGRRSRGAERSHGREGPRPRALSTVSFSPVLRQGLPRASVVRFAFAKTKARAIEPADDEWNQSREEPAREATATTEADSFGQ